MRAAQSGLPLDFSDDLLRLFLGLIVGIFGQQFPQVFKRASPVFLPFPAHQPAIEEGIGAIGRCRQSVVELRRNQRRLSNLPYKPPRRHPRRNSPSPPPARASHSTAWTSSQTARNAQLTALTCRNPARIRTTHPPARSPAARIDRRSSASMQRESRRSSRGSRRRPDTG